jgi:hypothetical protein
MWYGLLADVVVAVHLAYVCVVVFGFVAILVGAALRWRWVRNPWFRCIHLTMIGIVALEAILHITCPLTDLEDWLRTQAGQPLSGETFIGRLMHDLMFYQAPEWVFTVAYISFAFLVLSTFWLAPVRWRRPPPQAAGGGEVGPAARGSHRPGVS